MILGKWALVFVMLLGQVDEETPRRPQLMSISQIDVLPDGSVEPPGDVVKVRVVVSGQVPEATLTLRPMIFAENEPGQRIRSKTEIRDRDGNVAIVQPLARLSPSEIRDVEFKAPYSAMEIGVGKHYFAYEVEASIDGVPVVQRVSSASMLLITLEPRTEIEQLVPEARMENVSSPIFRVVNDEVITEQAEREIETVTYKRVSRKASIAGGFYRQSMTRPPAVDVPLAQSPLSPGENARVLFLTNRLIKDPKSTDGERFASPMENDKGKKFNELHVGSCLVHIPVDHKRGKFEEHHWLFNRDPKNYFHITQLHEIGREQFDKIVMNSLYGNQDVLIYVHGFANTFTSAATTLAQIGIDIQFPGRLLLFSWPSEGKASPASYRRDEPRAEASAPVFAQYLLDLIQSLEETKSSGRIHILAHSMGCRVTSMALHELEPKLKGQTSQIGNVILAAADVDVSKFVAYHRSIVDVSKWLTLYYSPEDVALFGSRGIHFEKRLGQGPFLTRPDTPDNIDARRVDTGWLGFGHNYINKADELAIDLEYLFSGKRANDRRTIRNADIERIRCWYFP